MEEKEEKGGNSLEVWDAPQVSLPCDGRTSPDMGSHEMGTAGQIILLEGHKGDPQVLMWCLYHKGFTEGYREGG